MGIFDYTLEKLQEYNINRGERKLKPKQLLQVHHRLNNITEFEPDDVFSQLTVCSVVVHNMERKLEIEHKMGSEIEKQFTDNLKAGDAIKINRSSIASITDSMGETDEE